MRKVFAKSLICLLCVAASANAGKKAVLNLIPTNGPPVTGHVLRLHQQLLNAAAFGDIPTAKNLLAQGADVNVVEDFSKTFTPLTYAATEGEAEMTRFLLAHGADPNNPEAFYSPLYWAVSYQKTECAKILLQHGADPRGNDTTFFPIDEAAQGGQVALVKMMIGRMRGISSAQAHTYRQTVVNIALSKAATGGKSRYIPALLRAGADVNNLDCNDELGQESPLMRATFAGSLPIMRFLLAHGAKVDLRNNEGETALMSLSETSLGKTNNEADAVLLLLQHGAKVGLKSKTGMTPLMSAAQGSPQATALLISHGAQINARDETGQTALHYAAASRDPKSLQVLLRNGASVNAQDKEGKTALMLASVNPDAPATAQQRAARRRALAVLKRFGANPRLKDKQGKTSSAYSKMEDSDFITAG